MRNFVAASRLREYKDAGVFPQQADLSWLQSRNPFTVQTISGNGSSTLFSLSKYIDDASNPFGRVIIYGGVAAGPLSVLSNAQYSLSRIGTTWYVAFSVAPPVGEIRVVHIY